MRKNDTVDDTSKDKEVTITSIFSKVNSNAERAT